jgi:spermidine dehydrogenase
MEDALGFNRRITRRDYLNATLLGAGSRLLAGASPAALLQRDWDGFGGVGDYRNSHGDSWEVMTSGHRIRVENPTNVDAIDTGEVYDCIVVGGGISGLAAALVFQRQAKPGRTCLVLDIHPIFGGLAKRNEFLVDGQRVIANQASAMFFPPLPGTFLADFYTSIGITEWQFPYQRWAGKDREIPLGQTSYTNGAANLGFWFGPRFGSEKGTWLIDPWGKKLDGAPIPAQARRELLAMRAVDPARLHGLPKQHGDALSRRLDSITLEQDLMEQYGLSRETVRTYLSPVAGGGSGIGADVLSAYAEIAADVLLPWDYDKGAQMFPGGNAGVARHIVKALIPNALPGLATQKDVCRSPVNFAALDRPGQACRIRGGSTVLDVRQEAAGVAVVYRRLGKLYRVKARTAIMAGGSWTTKHLIHDLPAMHREAYSQFHRAPCLVANVALRNWRFLYKMGISEAQWFEGIGNSFAIRKLATFGDISPTVSPDSPVVLTLKILYSHPGLPLSEQVVKGRQEMLSKSFLDYEREIRSHFAAMFADAGFDPRQDIAGIVLNRWGHAYLSAQPGFFFGSNGKAGPGEVLRNNPVGRIAFANSDLSGIMDHRASIQEADRAVKQVIYAGT